MNITIDIDQTDQNYVIINRNDVPGEIFRWDKIRVLRASVRSLGTIADSDCVQIIFNGNDSIELNYSSIHRVCNSGPFNSAEELYDALIPLQKQSV